MKNNNNCKKTLKQKKKSLEIIIIQKLFKELLWNPINNIVFLQSNLES